MRGLADPDILLGKWPFAPGRPDRGGVMSELENKWKFLAQSAEKVDPTQASKDAISGHTHMCHHAIAACCGVEIMRLDNFSDSSRLAGEGVSGRG
jgi:hypothetical protein